MGEHEEFTPEALEFDVDDDLERSESGDKGVEKVEIEAKKESSDEAQNKVITNLVF